MMATQLDRFLAIHQPQITAAGIPDALVQRLLSKLENSVFDASNFFEFSLNDELLVLHANVANARAELKAQSDIFLVDHAWTTTVDVARKKLQRTDEQSLKRIFSLLQMNTVSAEDREETEETAESVEELFKRGHKSDLEFSLQSAHLRSLRALRLAERLPRLEQLDVIGNEISDLQDVLESVRGLTDLRALWLKQNPVFEQFGATYAAKILELCPKLEILDTNFIEKNLSLWALRLICDLSSTSELDLTDRNLTRLPSHLLSPTFSDKIRTLDVRRNAFGSLSDSILPALKLFSKLEHLWLDPSLPGFSRKIIFETVPSLCTLNGNDDRNSEENFDREREQLIEVALNRMWRYNQYYKLSDDGTAVWYIPDELGLAIAHSDTPNVKMVPFVYSPPGSAPIAYSLLCPIRDIAKGDVISRDFLPKSVRIPALRALRLSAFFPHLLDEEPLKKRYLRHLEGLRSQSAKWQYVYEKQAPAGVSPFPPAQSFWSSPDDVPSASSPVTVFCNIELVRNQFAKRSEFKIVTESTDAKILWLYEPLLSFLEIPGTQILNQIPNEKCITVKDLLVETVQRVCGRPRWLPASYNLETELHEFVGDFLSRQDTAKSNVWIVKPWNLARGIGHTVSSDLSCILRQLETGPKVACEYICSPALYHHKKVDLRLMVAFKYGASESPTPPEVYVYKHFLTRFGNKNYSLDHFEDYEKHFTVMTFTKFKLLEVKDDEFIREFEQLYPNQKWTAIQQRVYSVLRLLFSAATAPTQTKGFRYRRNSFAVYGVDVLVDSEMIPHIIEVNFAPNCARLQSYHDFFGHLFDLLFFQRDPEGIWTRLL